ncbi:MAG TPA: hypothetical protein VF274_01110 [Alphaproteobacteria bacterium]
MFNRTGSWVKPLAIVIPIAFLAAGCATKEYVAAARKSAADAQAAAERAAASAAAAERSAQAAAQNSTRADRQFRESLRK